MVALFTSLRFTAQEPSNAGKAAWTVWRSPGLQWFFAQVLPSEWLTAL
jgi:hypothetical protein